MNTHVELGTRRVRRLSWGLAYTPAATLAVLLPKCPLCIAAPLALLGVTIPLPDDARVFAIGASVLLGTAVVLFGRKRCGGTCSRRTPNPA